MPFQPGVSGNPDGCKKPKRFFAALERAIVQDDGVRLRNAAEKLLDLAGAGEAWAIRELADRLDGRPAQILAGDPDAPLQFQEVTDVLEIGRRIAYCLNEADQAIKKAKEPEHAAG